MAPCRNVLSRPWQHTNSCTHKRATLQTHSNRAQTLHIPHSCSHQISTFTKEQQWRSIEFNKKKLHKLYLGPWWSHWLSILPDYRHARKRTVESQSIKPHSTVHLYKTSKAAWLAFALCLPELQRDPNYIRVNCWFNQHSFWQTINSKWERVRRIHEREREKISAWHALVEIQNACNVIRSCHMSVSIPSVIVISDWINSHYINTGSGKYVSCMLGVVVIQEEHTGLVIYFYPAARDM